MRAHSCWASRLPFAPGSETNLTLRLPVCGSRTDSTAYQLPLPRSRICPLMLCPPFCRSPNPDEHLTSRSTCVRRCPPTFSPQQAPLPARETLCRHAQTTAPLAAYLRNPLTARLC